MTEEEMESEILVPEIVPQNQLQVLVKESGLEDNKATFLLGKFANHFKEAAEWAKKANDIVVTNDNQTVLMKQARVGRLFLREKRLEIENIRKILKADALKEGQAIDRIANFLKDTIIPTEEHLLRQERFVEMKKEAEEERLRLEVEKRMEEERLKKEKEDVEEKERLRKENERLKSQNDKVESELRAKKQEEMKTEADRLKTEELLKVGSDGEMMEYLLLQIKNIKFPEFQSGEAKRIVGDCHGFCGTMKVRIKKFLDKQVQEEE